MTVARLEIQVRETDRATSPLARWVMRLERMPPGQTARIITPIAISGRNGRLEARANAQSGSSRSWPISPAAAALG